MTAAVMVVGEAVVDLIAESDQTYHAMPGGSPLNVAVSSARLGAPTYFVGRLAPDRFGALLRRHACEHDVDLTLSIDADEGAAALSVASLDPDGSAAYAFYLDAAPDWHWTPDTLPSPPSDVAIMHTGSLTTSMAPGSAAILDYCTLLRASGDVLVSFDANVRPSVTRDRVRAAALVDTFAAQAHVAKASVDDLAWLWPALAPVDIAHRWLAAGSGCVVITDGVNGAEVVTSGGVLHVPAVAVEVVDTVGAGDAFTAGFLSTLTADRELLRSWPVRCAQPPAVAFGAAAQRAAAAAALTCTRSGALGPAGDEVDKLLKDRKDDGSWQT